MCTVSIKYEYVYGMNQEQTTKLYDNESSNKYNGMQFAYSIPCNQTTLVFILEWYDMFYE